MYIYMYSNFVIHSYVATVFTRGRAVKEKEKKK